MVTSDYGIVVLNDISDLPDCSLSANNRNVASNFYLSGYGDVVFYQNKKSFIGTMGLWKTNRREGIFVLGFVKSNHSFYFVPVSKEGWNRYEVFHYDPSRWHEIKYSKRFHNLNYVPKEDYPF